MNFKKITSDTYDYDYFRTCERAGKVYITIREAGKYSDVVVECDTFGSEIYDRTQDFINSNYDSLYGELEPFVRLHQKKDGLHSRLGCFNRFRIESEFAEEIANKLYDKLMDIVYNKLKLKGNVTYLSNDDIEKIKEILHSYRFINVKTKIIDTDIALLDFGVDEEVSLTKEELVNKKQNIIETKKKLDELVQNFDEKSKKVVEMQYLRGEKYSVILRELKVNPATLNRINEQIFIQVHNCLFAE